MLCDKCALRLYGVTDRAWLGNMTLYEAVKQALRGGVTMLQLREKDLDPTDFLREARELRTLCRRYGVPFLINDNVEIAAACGADGVHVGQRDMEPARVRAILGEGKIVGVSAQTVIQAQDAERHGADYLGIGAVFPTSTKADADVVTLSTLREICAAVQIPAVAIGGITAANLPQLQGTGVAGVAVVSAIFAASDIASAATALLALTEELG